MYEKARRKEATAHGDFTQHWPRPMDAHYLYKPIMQKPSEIRAQIYDFIHKELGKTLNGKQHDGLKELLVLLARAENEVNQVRIRQLEVELSRAKGIKPPQPVAQPHADKPLTAPSTKPQDSRFNINLKHKTQPRPRSVYSDI